MKSAFVAVERNIRNAAYKKLHIEDEIRITAFSEKHFLTQSIFHNIPSSLTQIVW